MDAKLKKKYLVSISIALLASIITSFFFLFLPSFYEPFETKTLDLRFQLRGPIPQRQDIVFVEMDQPAIETLGRWPWPRDIFAHIVETLKNLECKAVLFDVTFTEPTQRIVNKEKLDSELKLGENKELLTGFIDDTMGALAQGQTGQIEGALAQLKNGISTWERQISQTLSETLKDDDQILAEAIGKAKNVYLGSNFEVVTSPLDLQRMKYDISALRNRVKDNPKDNFDQLPPSLRNAPGFNLQELHTMFIRAKIYALLMANLELTLNEAALAIKESRIDILRPNFNDVKEDVYRDTIERLLKSAPALSFKEAAWKTGLFNPANVQLLKKQYEDYLKDKAFTDKAAIADAQANAGSLTAIKMSPPILLLTQNMKSSGFLNAIPDPDGTLRKAPLLVNYNNKVYPHIALRVVIDLLGLNPQKDVHILPGKSITVGKINIPLDENGFLLLNWAGQWSESFQHLSASKVYKFWELQQNILNNSGLTEEELQKDSRQELLKEDKQKLSGLKAQLEPLIKNKICIIGLTAPGTHDYKPIPLESMYPAVGTHANVINTILEGKFLQRIDKKTTVVLILFLGLFTALCVTMLSSTLSLLFIILATFLYAAAAFLAFVYQGTWIDIIGPVGAAVVSYIGIISYNFATEEKEKRWIRKAFGHYISKNVMEEILKDPKNLKLGGERRELTVLFADVRGFTSYSEKRQPEEVVAILNEYLDEMTKIIFAHGGTLDKYVGDQIMAIFGAPSTVVQTDHAEKAVGVALEMISRLKTLQEKWVAQGKEPLDIGIGINTGPMLVGNMGSTERMDYTVIGDAVNLGSRVETLTRHYNNHIIISEFTRAHLKDLFEVKPLDSIKVKGKQDMVMMYEVLGLKAGGKNG